MTGVKLEAFGGMIPVASRRLLPNTAAEYAANTDLVTGELRPLRYPAEIHVFESTIRKAFRIPDLDHPDDPVWLGLRSRNANLARNPITNDLFKRYVYIDDNEPNVPQRLVQNTIARMRSGDSPFLLGVPAPTVTLGVAVVGGSGIVITRAYLYTFVNLFGEEGTPVAPSTASGFINGTWNLTDLAAPADYAARGLTNINIYRTVTADDGGTQYYRVATVAITATSYSDSISDGDVTALGIVLLSTSWAEPLAMEGLVQMPNGILAGWKANQVYFSEPYRPWAWPVAYTLSVRYDIIGCAVTDQTLVVLTTGAPSFITGTTPAGMSIADSPVIEPCLSAHGITAGPDGVYYISRNGMIVVSSSGIENVSQTLVGQTVWRTDYATEVTGLARFESQVVTFQTGGRGFIMDSRDPRVALQRIKNFAEVDNIWTDPFTGETHLCSGNGVYLWGPSDAPYATALWRSKEFQLPKPVNFGALIVSLDAEASLDTVAASVLPPPPPPPTGGPWDDLASTIGYARIFGAPIGVDPTPGDVAPDNDAGTAGWPFWPGVIDVAAGFDAEESLFLQDGVACVVTVYAGRERVWARAISTNVMYRLPSGFKSDIWQLSIVSRVPVFSLHLAETGKELARV